MVHDMIWWYSSSEDGKGLHQFGFLVSIFVENKWISCCSKTKRESGCHDGFCRRYSPFMCFDSGSTQGRGDWWATSSAQGSSPKGAQMESPGIVAQGAHRSTEKKSDSSVSRISSWPKSGFLWKQGFLENLLWLIIINVHDFRFNKAIYFGSQVME